MPEMTARRTLIGQIMDRLQEIEALLIVRQTADPETSDKYIQTIKTFTVARLRDNPNELMRISAMLNSLMRDIKDFEITDRIRTLRQLIDVTQREFDFNPA